MLSFDKDIIFGGIEEIDFSEGYKHHLSLCRIAFFFRKKPIIGVMKRAVDFENIALAY